MSEEAQKLAEQLVGKTYFYVTEEKAFAPGIAEGWPEYIPAPHTRNGRLKRVSTESLVAALNAFASQVCEQREKVGFCEKHAPNPSQSYAGCWVCSRNEETELLKEVLRTLGWMKDKEAGWYLAEDSDAADGPKFYDFHDAVAAALDDYEVFRAAYKKSHLYGAGQQQRAEAAELALQSRDKRISELGADICNMNDSIAEIVCQDLADWDWKTCLERVKNLRAALQAKERELAKICEAHNYGVNILTELAAAKLELAQARQQAIAGLKRELCELAELGAQGNSQPAAFALRRFADVIREFNPSTLTPPPALTDKNEDKP